MNGEGQAEFCCNSRPLPPGGSESEWHPSQEINDLVDGGWLVAVRISEPTEMKPWMRGWGAEVEVIFIATMRSPLRSKRVMLALISRLCAASGLTISSVRSVRT